MEWVTCNPPTSGTRAHVALEKTCTSKTSELFLRNMTGGRNISAEKEQKKKIQDQWQK